MCKCTPHIRNLYCGGPGCEWPVTAAPPKKEGIKHFKHRKSGNLYEFVCYAKMEATGELVVVYESPGLGGIWVRPAAEFFDKFAEQAEDV
jgi:hypothetical protein